MQGGPRRFPWPALGQVQGQPPGFAGQPGWDVDQMGANCRGARAGVEGAGQRARGTSEVVRDRPQHRPRRVCWEGSAGQVRQRTAGGVSDDLVDDGVATVLGFGLQCLEGAGDGPALGSVSPAPK